MRSWYCARTEPNREYEARRNLERKGFTTFLPGYLQKYASKNIRLRLLFRNYIFVSFDDPMRWPDVQHTNGIHQVLLFSQDDQEYLQPSNVGSEEIETLRACALTYDDFSTKRQPQQYITEGCYVRILTGPLKDTESAQRALVEWEDGERAALALMLFNRETRVEFFIKDLELIKDPKVSC